jgi:hypothetical protein
VHDRRGAHALGTGSASTGTVKKNVDPFPGSLSTQIRPPCSSTNFLVMLSPRPVPPNSLATVGVGLAELGEEVVELLGRDADAVSETR